MLQEVLETERAKGMCNVSSPWDSHPLPIFSSSLLYTHTHTIVSFILSSSCAPLFFYIYTRNKHAHIHDRKYILQHSLFRILKCLYIVRDFSHYSFNNGILYTCIYKDIYVYIYIKACDFMIWGKKKGL